MWHFPTTPKLLTIYRNLFSSTWSHKKSIFLENEKICTPFDSLSREVAASVCLRITLIIVAALLNCRCFKLSNVHIQSGIEIIVRMPVIGSWIIKQTLFCVHAWTLLVLGFPWKIIRNQWEILRDKIYRFQTVLYSKL